MKGSVTKYAIKGSSRPRWRYRLYLGKDASGKKLWDGGKGGFKTETEAWDAVRQRFEELAREREARENPRPEPMRSMTLGEWLQTWFDTYAADKCQRKTLDRYKELALYVTKNADGTPSELSKTPLLGLKHTQIEPALFALLKAKGKRREHVSPRTVRHVAAVLSVALNKAFKLDMIPVNPMLRVELPAVPRQDAQSLIPAQIRSLREACQGDWTFALVEVTLGCGARRGEMLAVQWPDLEWISGTLKISKSLEQTSAGLRVKRPKNEKTRSERLPRAAIAALQFLRDQQQEHRRLFGSDYKDNDLIFCQPDGSYLEPDLVSQVIIRRMRKAGIKKGSFHTLRHTHASNLLSRGVPLPAVSARLGHSDPNVTARVYSHALPADDQRAADVWDTIIDGPVQ